MAKKMAEKETATKDGVVATIGMRNLQIDDLKLLTKFCDQFGFTFEVSADVRRIPGYTDEALVNISLARSVF